MVDEVIVPDVAPAPAAAPAAAPAEPAAAPAAAAPAAAPDAGTVLAPGAAPAPAETSWYADQPDDWREQIAGDNEAHLNVLKRMADPTALFKGFFSGQDTIRARQENQGLPKDPSAEQLTEYRAENGIPETAAGYELSLSEGLVLSEQETADLAPVFELMHGQNMNSEQASQLVDTYMGIQDQQAQRRQDQDHIDTTNANVLLKQNWAGDFEQNKNILNAMLVEHLPGETLDGFLNARMADGTAIFNDAGVMSALANIARAINPAATLVPGGSNAIGSLEDTIKDLEARMGTPEWFKDDAAQKQYLEATTALATLKGRQAA